MEQVSRSGRWPRDDADTEGDAIPGTDGDEPPPGHKLNNNTSYSPEAAFGGEALYESPSPSPSSDDLSPASLDSASGASMLDQPSETDPAVVDKRSSPSAATAAGLGRLSLDHQQQGDDQPPRQYHRGRVEQAFAGDNHHAKRSAGLEFEQPPGKRSPPTTPIPYAHSKGSVRHSPPRRHAAKPVLPRAHKPVYPHVAAVDHKPVNVNLQYSAPRRFDSGYESKRADTLQSPQSVYYNAAAPVGPPFTALDARAAAFLTHPDPTKAIVTGQKDIPLVSPHRATRYADLILQPESAPITQEQLAAEVKGIYAGLVMVEAKCINIDAQQAADPKAELGPEQWQALIALHRTLLYEHHDFLMATQHPSANTALKGLASKYCMPARMWKHGIHAFLEVLRHRRPQSQEYMLTFIYLAYQMMALLFETVPAFLDTWIECLGDLARYRMAIEEDKEVHATWGSVAGRWYTMAADGHPGIGRLYHHLGILERPSLRKFYYYARSLTSVVPFVNAKESLATLCAPILQDEHAVRSGSHSAEAITICFHARVFSRQTQSLVERDGRDALDLLRKQTSGKIASYGVALAVTNIAALFEYGAPQNILRTMFNTALARDAHNARPSVVKKTPEMLSEAAKAVTDSAVCFDSAVTTPSDFVISFFADCFNNLIRRELDQATIRDLMQFVHINLVWICSLLDLRPTLIAPAHIALVDRLLSLISWQDLAIFLNALIQVDAITSRIEDLAARGEFIMPERRIDKKPLAEDYSIRGIVWAENYFSPDLFQWIEDDDGSRTLESPSRLHFRAERVAWLGCVVAQPVKQCQLSYSRTTHLFSAEPAIKRESMDCADAFGGKYEPRSETAVPVSPGLVSSAATMSAHSSVGGDFEMISVPSDTQSSVSEVTKSALSSKQEALKSLPRQESDTSAVLSKVEDNSLQSSPLPKSLNRSSVVSGDESLVAIKGSPEKSVRKPKKPMPAEIKIEGDDDGGLMVQ